MAQIVRQDFLLNSNGDFPLQDTVIGGVWQDTPYGDSDQQHIADITFYGIGWLKQFPTLGIFISQYLNAENAQQSLDKLSRIQFKSDGYTVQNGFIVPQTGGGFTVNTKFVARM